MNVLLVLEKMRLNYRIRYFSNMDSYLSVVHGEGPLLFRSVTEEERDKLIKEGKSPGDRYRYRRKMAYSSNQETKKAHEELFESIYASRNNRYQKEYNDAIHIRGQRPDLALCIDDTTEYASALLRVYPRPKSKDSKEDDNFYVQDDANLPDYFFLQDVIEPFKRFLPTTIILATKKEFFSKMMHLLEYKTPSQSSPTIIKSMSFLPSALVEEEKQERKSQMFIRSSQISPSILPSSSEKKIPTSQQFIDTALRSEEERKKLGNAVGDFKNVDLNEVVKRFQDMEPTNKSLDQIKSCLEFAKKINISNIRPLSDFFQNYNKAQLNNQLVKKGIGDIESILRKMTPRIDLFGKRRRAEDLQKDLNIIKSRIESKSIGVVIHEDREIFGTLSAFKIEIDSAPNWGMADEMKQISGILDDVIKKLITEAKPEMISSSRRLG